MLTYPDISKIDKSSPALIKKIACFLISFLIHSLFLYWMFTAKYTVKIFPAREEITEVIIASPEKTFIPENIEDLIKNRDLSGLSQNRKLSERAIKFGEKIETKGPGFIEKSGKEIETQAGSPAVPSQFSSRFNLESPARSQSNLPEGYKLNLSSPSKKEQKLFYPVERGGPTKGPNLMNYLYSGYSRIHSEKGYSYPGRPATGRPTQRPSISFAIEKYDLTPWAEKVVNQIQKNWTILPGQKTNISGEVGISVLIEKDGEISDIAILSSSNDPLLDQSALEALEASSPFPVLPADFPAKNLEIYFVFHYE